MNSEQLALRSSVRALLAKHSDVRKAMELPRGHDPDLWLRLCDIGVLPIPAEYGGSGASLAETHIVLEELGRTLTPSPLLGATIAVQALLATGNDEACRRLLPGIAAGTTLAALVSSDASERDAQGHRSTQTSRSLVLDGDVADVLLVADGSSLFEVSPDQPGVSRVHTPTMDPTRRLARITLTGPARTRLGPAPDLGHVALAALAAEQVGAAARCLELTVSYTKGRVQFGRPIASFQALQHRMADLHVLVETARSAALAATDPVSAAVAKVYCSEAFSKVAAEMIQLHGGIAITWEHDAHLYFKRAHGSAQLFGSPAEHVRRLTAMLQPA
ncbi:acyl-CoA dehydrogenase [Lentzea sp. NBRC 105346]|nr:acyl-CoA dehydrogenase [Lentzea sp. NBRC 105346]